MLSIWVECTLAGIPPQVRALAETTDIEVVFSFRLTRAGNVSRKLGTVDLNEETFGQLREYFRPIYIPPIRDLDSDGLAPFRELVAAALLRGKGPGSLKQITEDARDLLNKRAGVLLGNQDEIAKHILRADRISFDTSRLNLSGMYDKIGLQVHHGANDISLNRLGTGHQSAVIMHLYRQLGGTMPGEVLYLFEEPDNHLHPPTIRSICDDLRAISEQSQVLISTHSPVFLAHVGFSPLRPLEQPLNGFTVQRKLTLLSNYSEKEARKHLDFYGIRITEPLLCRRVIVVEGPTDKEVLSALLENRRKLSPDQADILIVSAGGKGQAPRLCHLLECLGVDWWCILDGDAAICDEVPHTKPSLLPTDMTAGDTAIDTLKRLADTSTRRGKNFIKTLDAVKAEFLGSRPLPTLLDGSRLKSLLDKIGNLTLAELGQLKVSLQARQKKASRKLLAKAKVFLWSGTLEDVLLHNAECFDTLEAALVKLGELTAPLTADPNREAALRNSIHDAGNRPELLFDLVVALDNAGCLSKTEVNACFELVFKDIQ